MTEGEFVALCESPVVPEVVPGVSSNLWLKARQALHNLRSTEDHDPRVQGEERWIISPSIFTECFWCGDYDFSEKVLFRKSLSEHVCDDCFSNLPALLEKFFE